VRVCGCAVSIEILALVACRSSLLAQPSPRTARCGRLLSALRGTVAVNFAAAIAPAAVVAALTKTYHHECHLLGVGTVYVRQRSRCLFTLRLSLWRQYDRVRVARCMANP
jgi:hypothetical protein